MTKSRGILAPRVNWTPEQVATLRQLYPDHNTTAIAAQVGKEIQQVYRKATKLGLKKSPKYLAGPDACRLRRGDQVGAATRFKPGMPAWNKGKPMPTSGRAAETQFKPGQSPHNTLPIGSYRITRDGNLQRKISNNKGNNSQRWRGVHELVWIAANGPVPPGHIVAFKPGQRTAVLEEITLDKVECRCLADHMLHNSVQNLPKELAVLVQLTGALNRKINRKDKQNGK